ncbi:MAG: carbon-nitrogen hydrolase family protein [Chloroflexi bacterium]|nr:carbon-nitrogen hydrolase family protein [Chloroflexota bacterium]MCI0646255.1 carbon-nitrogen hydrolase family protein [Chloroflexota bacterium]MCI0732125.1 carbon-nitrogen hydrolase family protein [Chloroflexota bacterium]
MFTNLHPFLAAAVQDSPVYLNLEASVAKACDLIAQAGRLGAQLVVFAETWLPGYPVWLDLAPSAALWDHPPAKAVFTRLFQNSATIPGPAVEQLGQAAKAAGAVVVMGLHERDGGTLYNTSLYLGPDGQMLGKHRKLMPTYTERLVWGQGDGSTLTVVETPFGRLGGLVCWEHWMPLARAAMHGRQELVHAAQWPTVKEMHQVASRHYAFEGQCFVVAAGSVLRRRELDGLGLALLDEIPGSPDDWLMRGGSAIIAPSGDYLAGPLFDEPGFVTAEIQPHLAIEGRLTLDVTGHYARPDVFQLHISEKPQANVHFD